VVSYTLETGETLTYDFVFNPAYLGDEIIGFSQVGRNITELKRTEEQLRQALQEKELLMKELNHRIKNNLAMISSLIGLKESEYDHEVDLTDIEHQIDAIRIVHEMLYKGDDITHIDMQTYVQELLLTIFSSFSMQHVRIENEIEQASVRTKFAIPLGLIINEIAINAIKHGFDHGEEAWFSIRLWKDPAENRRVLEMSNSGSSFPEEIPLENPETLGLRLVSVLVDQIGGTIELERFPATTFRISFPAV
jgi:two-component sensor histidine kinase